MKKINKDILLIEEGAETLEYVVVAALILGPGLVAYNTGITPLFVFNLLAAAMNSIG